MYTKDKRRKKELIMDHHKRVQTSEAFINSAFLAVSGGFQDAYTYFTAMAFSPTPRPETWY